ncbi:MAG: phosphate acyltransferase PlsX [Ectothiorhodospiraceae bacterium]|nr:phosphate acyltransferase PlsX [Ectothiorhodospiraceae bacterium]
MTFTVALDAMGGDHGPSVVVPAALRALERDRDLALILVGDEATLLATLAESKATPSERLRLHHATQKVEMDELPSQALRGKRDSSMRVAINLVKEGEAQACVSAGNTGALMATAKFVLRTLPGVDRPAIISALPSLTGHTHVLDLGANVEASARQLFEFAVMGVVLARAVDNIAQPTVGLLNIGQEEIKGNERVREAGRMLAASDLDYIGFVEGDDIYRGKANIVVCDGFVGNVALKSSEGVAHMIVAFMRREFQRNILTRVAGLVAMPVLRALRSRIDPRQYNGATLVGLQGIVVKSHGSADVIAFARAIEEAVTEIRKNVPERIREQLGRLLESREAV